MNKLITSLIDKKPYKNYLQELLNELINYNINW